MGFLLGRLGFSGFNNFSLTCEYRVCTWRVSAKAIDDTVPVQSTVTSEAMLQVGQTKPVDKIICGHQQECNDAPSLDRPVCLSIVSLSQVPSKAVHEHAVSNPYSLEIV